MPTIVTNFCSVPPANRLAQDVSLDWLAAAHARAEATQSRLNQTPIDEAAFRHELRRRLERFGCGSHQISWREVDLDDCSHQRFSEMDLYCLDQCPSGATTRARTEFFDKAARRAITRLYADIERAPSDLIHVTCTGYVSPSAGQQLAERKGWGDTTRVTHAYHMGCYAAFPALRIAAGLLRDSTETAEHDRRTDIVHTEICSLHFHPLLHSPEQLVVQSLFADGFIRYSVVDEAHTRQHAPGFLLLGSHEQIIPNSSDAMTWLASDHGMHMTLARDVPDRLMQALPEFVRHLVARAGVPESDLHTATYAIHPGGPKILDCALQALLLDESQISASRRLLRARGNMSSATLPHVWMDLLLSSATPHDSLIVSLAFGPGLTLCGTVMRKVES
ncbi:MAG TPA: hypothetical protein VKP30_22235 [Polyangiaceae bacterium]|nr:hypothetical protein [Polyangiaceae bacterium]